MANIEKRMNDKLRSVLGSVQKAFGTESIRVLDGEANEAVDASSSGCLALDRALGIGGYARGRIIEIFGPESSGKTTLTLHAIAEVQREGGLAAFVDAEHAFDPAYARATGVRTSVPVVPWIAALNRIKASPTHDECPRMRSQNTTTTPTNPTMMPSERVTESFSSGRAKCVTMAVKIALEANNTAVRPEGTVCSA